MKLENGDFVVAAAPTAAAPAAGGGVAQKPKQILPAAISDDIKTIITKWRSILKSLDDPIASALESSRQTLGNDNKLLIVFDKGDVAYDRVIRESSKEAIGQALNDLVGKEVAFNIQEAESHNHFEDGVVDLSALINFEVETEEE